jgi:hypothetical protein
MIRNTMIMTAPTGNTIATIVFTSSLVSTTMVPSEIMVT